MKPLQHAKISAHKHGGKWEDYVDIHEFFDNTKAFVPDMRHRAILHNAWGIYMAQLVFGLVRVNSDGREYSVRDIGEEHVLEDIGMIPTLSQVIESIDIKHLKWLGGPQVKKQRFASKSNITKTLPNLEEKEDLDPLDCVIDTGYNQNLRD